MPNVSSRPPCYRTVQTAEPIPPAPLRAFLFFPLFLQLSLYVYMSFFCLSVCPRCAPFTRMLNLCSLSVCGQTQILWKMGLVDFNGVNPRFTVSSKDCGSLRVKLYVGCSVFSILGFLNVLEILHTESIVDANNKKCVEKCQIENLICYFCSECILGL